MTVTKQELDKMTAHLDPYAVIYVDNGVDSMECRGITVVQAVPQPGVSAKEDGSPLEVGSVVLHLAT